MRPKRAPLNDKTTDDLFRAPPEQHHQSAATSGVRLAQMIDWRMSRRAVRGRSNAEVGTARGLPNAV